LKPYEDRLTVEPSTLQSPTRDDDDLELLMYIPFTEAVSIRTICVSRRDSVYKQLETKLHQHPSPAKYLRFVQILDFVTTARDLEADAHIEMLPPEHLSAVQINNDVGGGTLDCSL